MKIKKISFKQLKISLLKIAVTLACIALLAWPEISGEGIKTGINYCINVLVPSLFPFMVIASFVVESNFLRIRGKFINWITKFIFYLPSYTLPTILLSLFGGYPVGAKGVGDLFKNEQISTEQLNRMMCFCVNAGPAFIISVLGSIIFKNIFLGITIFFAQVLSSIAIGISCGIFARINKCEFFFKKLELENQDTNTADALIKSVSSASKSILEMCSLIVIFSCFLSFFEKLNIFDAPTTAILTSVFEITQGCSKMANLIQNPLIIAFAIGYGGICAHLQISSILKNKDFNFKKFCLFRLVNATLSVLITQFAMNFFPLAINTFSNLKTPVAVSNASTIHGGIAILLLCIYFTATLNELFAKREI